MGKLTWEGWQTSVSNAPQPTSILYGANLRKSLNKESPETQQKLQNLNSSVALSVVCAVTGYCKLKIKQTASI